MLRRKKNGAMKKKTKTEKKWKSQEYSKGKTIQDVLVIVAEQRYGVKENEKCCQLGVQWFGKDFVRLAGFNKTDLGIFVSFLISFIGFDSGPDILGLSTFEALSPLPRSLIGGSFLPVEFELKNFSVIGFTELSSNHSHGIFYRQVWKSIFKMIPAVQFG